MNYIVDTKPNARINDQALRRIQYERVGSVMEIKHEGKLVLKASGKGLLRKLEKAVKKVRKPGLPDYDCLYIIKIPGTDYVQAAPIRKTS